MPEQRSENYGEGKPTRLRNRLIFSVIVGLLVFVALSIYADIGEILQAFAGFKWGYILLILALTLLNYLLRFYKWDYYLRNIDVKLRGRDSLAIFLSGLTLSVTPAKLGEVFKSYLLKRLKGIEVSRSIPVVFAERATDVLGLLILAAISFSAFKYGLEMLVIVLALMLMLIAIVQSRRLCVKLIKASRSVPLINKLSDNLIITYESAYALFRVKILLVAIVVSVISWGFECLAMYFVLAGFGIDASMSLSTFVFSFSSLAGAISMIPGGLGVAEASVVGLLILSGIPKGIAASATVIIRFCTLWFGVLIGLITTFIIRDKIS